MGDPFAGYVRDPSSVTDAPSPAALGDEIRMASAKYGVPEDVLRFVWSWEAGSSADIYQEVGVNSGGYGGFYGLPQSLIGDMRGQTETAASILRKWYDQTGSWSAAINVYNTGQPDQGYGSSFGGAATRTTAAPATLVSDTKPAADATKVAAVSGGRSETAAHADPAPWTAIVSGGGIPATGIPDPHLPTMSASGPAPFPRALGVIVLALFALLILIAVIGR